jgi:hypothetical protein
MKRPARVPGEPSVQFQSYLPVGTGIRRRDARELAGATRYLNMDRLKEHKKETLWALHDGGQRGRCCATLRSVPRPTSPRPASLSVNC